MSPQNTTEPDTNGIKDYATHWKATLLGEDFWKDAEDWNKDTNDEIDTGKSINSTTRCPSSTSSPNLLIRKFRTDHDQALHTRFPFNIGPEQAQTPAQTPQATPSIVTTSADADDGEEVEVAPPGPGKRSRRFSMNDAFGVSVNTLTRRGSPSLLSGSRVLELSRNSRSQSRSNNLLRSSSVAADVRRSNSMIRSTLNRLSRKKKKVDEDNDEEQEQEVEVETEDESPALPNYPDDQATPANPLMEFRGGILWAALPKDRRALGIDVFWPIPVESSRDKKGKEKKLKYRTTGDKQESPPNEAKENGKEKEVEQEEDDSIFHIDNMAPLCMFRNLRVLKITGMMQSYQMYIFQAAWLNPHLGDLEIGMALPPRLNRHYKWPYIKGGWRLDKRTYAEPTYQ